MVQRTRYCNKSSHTDGFTQLASTTNQTRLPFDNDIELASSTVCVMTPPLWFELLGRVEAAPRSSVLWPFTSESDHQEYIITDLYKYTSCSAVALIVVELRPGGTVAMRTRIYI